MRPRVGMTGHQTMSPRTAAAVEQAIRAELLSRGPFVGVCSLAVGADQIFAGLVLETDNVLEVVIPSHGYESTFEQSVDLLRYRELLDRAACSVRLDNDDPTEAAFFAAGREVVRRSDILLAVWDGRPAAGLGGTADVVAYAKNLDREVVVIWPPGASRK